MVHFLTLEERPMVMGRLRDALPPGSHITATHVTVEKIEGVHAATPTPIYVRTHVEIARFFDGFEMVESGLVTIDEWRPDPPPPLPRPPSGFTETSASPLTTAACSADINVDFGLKFQNALTLLLSCANCYPVRQDGAARIRGAASPRGRREG